MKSIYHQLPVLVGFPEFTGRLLYMHKTRLDEVVLPPAFKDYAETIEQIISGIDRNVIGYITIDEKIVSNDTHRRPGIHCDFNWYENLNGHDRHMTGLIGNHISPSPGRHSAPIPEPSRPGHGISPGRHSDPTPLPTPGHGTSPSTHNITSLSGNWRGDAKFNDGIGGGMLLTSNYSGCKVYRGEFEGIIGEGGDCRNIDVSHLENEVMANNNVYFLNALGIHEGLVIKETVNRSLVRINFHPDYQFKLVA